METERIAADGGDGAVCCLISKRVHMIAFEQTRSGVSREVISGHTDGLRSDNKTTSMKAERMKRKKRRKKKGRKMKTSRASLLVPVLAKKGG